MASALETQICVACGKEFSSAEIDPIPTCPACLGAEQTNTSEREDFQPEATRTVTLHSLRQEEARGNVEAEEDQGPSRGTEDVLIVDRSVLPPSPRKEQWHVRKTGGRIFGPFDSAQLRLWVSQGKIVGHEEVARLMDTGAPQWKRVAEDPELAKLLLPVPPVSDAPLHLEEGTVTRTLHSRDVGDDVEDGTLDLQERPAPVGRRSLFRSRSEPTEEPEKLFGVRSRSRSFELVQRAPRTVLWGGIGFALFCFAAVAVFFFREPITRWMTSRQIEKDRVDEYIAEFTANLGPIQGDPTLNLSVALDDLTKMTEPSIARAERVFQAILVREPLNAAAMAALAEIYAERGAQSENTRYSTRAYDLAFKAQRLAPQLARSHRAVGRLLLRLGNRLDDARRSLDQALAMDPTDRVSRGLDLELRLAELSEGAGRGDIAELEGRYARHFASGLTADSTAFAYGAVLRRWPDPRAADRIWSTLAGEGQGEEPLYAARARIARATLLSAMRRFREAQAALAPAVATSLATEDLSERPDLVEAALWSADLAAFALGDIAGAKKILDPLLQREVSRLPESRQKLVLTMAALWQAQSGKGQDARGTFSKLLSQDSYHRLGRYNFAALEIEQGSASAALERLEGLRGWKEGPLLFPYYYARALDEGADRQSEAVQVLQEALLAHPDQAFLQLGMSRLMLRLQNSAASEDVLEKAMLQNLEEGRRLPPFAFAVWPGVLPTGELKERVLAMVREDRNSPGRLAMYAYILYLEGLNDQSVRVAEQGLQLDSQHLPLLHLYAHLLLRSGRTDRSIEVSRAALRIDPQQRNILLTLAQGYLQAGKPAVARVHVQAVLDQGKPNAAASYWMGQVRSALGDRTEAIGFYLDAVRRDPMDAASLSQLYEAGEPSSQASAR